jgi:hypothetical protein
MALFLCPLFTLFRFKGLARRRAAIAGVGVGIAVLMSLTQILKRTSPDYHHDELLHRSLPFMGNLIHPGGLGPITLTDVYIFERPQPRLPDAFWERSRKGFDARSSLSACF